MNYFIHNFTSGYEKSNCNLRETILYLLKGYGILQHLRDANFDRLDQNDPKQWLWNEDDYKQDIKSIQSRLKEQKLKIKSITEEELQLEYTKEINRISWSNNPESNYYQREADRIQTCLDDYGPKLKKFMSLCGMQFLNEGIEDILRTAKMDLNTARFNAQHERNTIIHNPKHIPTYEEFKRNYIERQEDRVNEFESRLEDKKKSLKRIKQWNKEILKVFQWIDQAESEIRLEKQLSEVIET